MSLFEKIGLLLLAGGLGGYGTIRVVLYLYFKAKLKYQMELIREIEQEKN